MFFAASLNRLYKLHRKILRSIILLLIVFALQSLAVAVLNKNTANGVVTSPSAVPPWVLFWT